MCDAADQTKELICALFQMFGCMIDRLFEGADPLLDGKDTVKLSGQGSIDLLLSTQCEDRLARLMRQLRHAYRQLSLQALGIDAAFSGHHDIGRSNLIRQ